VEYFVASHAYHDGQFWREQLPALCMDGRLKNDSLANLAFSIDDRSVDTDSGRVVMKCQVPVHIYPCPGPNAASCRGFESEMPLLAPRVSNYDADVTCVHESSIAMSRVCEHLDFTCATGPCTAYEKTGRLCAANLISPTMYECYYTRRADDPVRKEYTSFPIWWVLLLAVISVPVLLGVGLFAKGIQLRWRDVGMQGLFFELAISCFCLAFLVLLCMVLRRISHEQVARGDQAVTMAQFALKAGPDGQLVIPNEEPVSKQRAWLRFFGILGFGCCLGCVCFCCLGCFGRKADATMPCHEEEREDEEEDSDSPMDALIEP